MPRYGFYDSLKAGSQIDSYRIEAPVARSGMAPSIAPQTCVITAR